MNDLSELLEGCEPLKEGKRPNYETLARARELKDLGFDFLAKKMTDAVLMTEKLQCIAAEKYPVITTEKIVDFLNKKVVEYNGQKKAKARSGIFSGLIGDEDYDDPQFITTSSSGAVRSVILQESSNSITISKYTKDFLSRKGIRAFVWTEVPVKDYKAIPPAHALAALKNAMAKEIFDEFTIGAVTAMKDPFLLGRINGSDDRYFLAQWGDDIALDDVI